MSIFSSSLGKAMRISRSTAELQTTLTRKHEMDINSIYGSTGASLIESIYGQNSKSSSEESKKSVSFFGADSVTISDEAMEKLTAMTVEKSKEENAQSENESGADAASGGGSSGGNDSKIQSLKAKLASLQTALGQASGSEVSGISAQIGQLMGEIAALEAESAA
jgi:hypothetical protein